MIDEVVEHVDASPDNAVVETPSEPSVQAQEAQKVSAREKEDNLRILRERADRASRERDEYARRLQELENAKHADVPDEEFSMKEDDLVEGKHLAKYVKRIKQLEEQQRRYMQQSQESTAEMKLRSQHADFDKVMTLENVKTFSQAYPELAKSINASNDLYDKAYSAYTLIKKFGIYEETPYESDKVRAEANMAKPRPLASVSPQQGDSPLSRANAFAEGLTDELRAQLRKDMDAARKLY